MKKTRIYICDKKASHCNIVTGELLTEFEGLYEMPLAKHETRVNGELFLIKRLQDDFSKEGVIRCLFLVKF